MILHNRVHSYGRSVGQVGMRQHLARRSFWELPGGVVLWRAAGKTAAVLVAVLALVQILLGTYASSLVTRAQVVETQRHELVDDNISLLAQRAVLLAPSQIEAAAGEELSLQRPGDGQLNRFNTRKGRFESL